MNERPELRNRKSPVNGRVWVFAPCKAADRTKIQIAPQSDCAPLRMSHSINCWARARSQILKSGALARPFKACRLA